MDRLKQRISKKASSYFRRGYNCAEGVLMAMQEVWQMNKKTPNIATGFGAGIGRQGSVCGSVTGGVIAINLKYGRLKAEQEEEKEKTYDLARNFYRRFEGEFGSALCCDLIECDPATPEGQEKYRELDLKEKKCVGFIEGAVRILMDLVE